MDPNTYDLTILGGGPVGLYAAYYAGFRTMRAKIIESLGVLGGQIIALYPEKWVYDVAGFPRILGRDLVDNLIAQAQQYQPAICTGETVGTLIRTADGTLRLVTNRAAHETRVLLITAGIGAFRPKTFNKSEIDSFAGKGLYYFVQRFQDFAGRRVLIAGGGDSAVDWANGLVRIAEAITLIHRRDRFRAHEDSIQKMLSSGVSVKVFTELRRLEGRDGVERAVVYQNQTGAEEALEVDAVIASLGFLSSLGPIQKWGLALDGDGIRVNTRMETNMPGVYAAGDIARFPGR